MTGTKTQDLTFIRRSNLALYLLLATASLYAGRIEVPLGVMLGGVISILNFNVLSRMVAAATRPGTHAGAFAAKIMMKVLLLMGSVTVTLLWVPVDMIAFVVGLSITFISIGLNGLVNLFRGPSVNPESTDA